MASFTAAGVLIWHLTRPAGDDADPMPAAERAALSTTARNVIEDDATSPLASHLSTGDAAAGAGRLACAVRVLGTEPAAVRRAADARTVYVWAHCEAVGTPAGSASSLPVAVHLTDPPTADIPGDGSRYRPDTQRIFPERVRDDIDDQEGADDDTLRADLARRVRERSQGS